MISYTIFKTLGMFNHKYNEINHTEQSKSVEQLLQKYKYNDMTASVFFALSNDTYYYTLEDFEPYVKIQYSQKIVDYGQKLEEIYDTKYFEPCTQEDFSVDEKSLDYYVNSYSFFPIMCIHPTSEIYLEGTDSTSYRKTIYVTVKKCENST